MTELQSFPFKTTPFSHQAEEFVTSGNQEIRGILWEQGTGKSKLTIDTAANLYLQEEIDAVLVVAPNGVHGNWIFDEIPAHLPDEVPVRSLEWESKKAKTQKYQRSLEALIRFEGLAFLSVNYDVFARKGAAREFVDRFLAERKVFFICDESQRIKTPGAKRTQAICRLGREFPKGKPVIENVRHRRILSGTPVTQSPLDIYAQLKFLDWDLWRREGFASFESFKTNFAIYEKMVRTSDGAFKRRQDCTPGEIRGASGRFDRLVAHKNLDQLQEIVDRYCSRVTKDAVLDLPDKIYTKRYFEMSPRQRKLYEEIRDDFMAFLDSGEAITAPLVIVRLLRLQQITCGYVPSDDCDTMHYLGDNPRMNALLDVLNDVDGKAIIWARFRQDINQICAELGEHAVRYDGSVSHEQRLENRRRFQDPNGPRFFVANPAAAATGLTLTEATTVIYYSNSFKLEDRLQSEDRAHRIGQKSNVRYIDLVASGTVDAKIVAALRKKLDLASQVTGDKIRDWI
jgi:SNF2 family DNA or RNA helicase